MYKTVLLPYTVGDTMHSKEFIIELQNSSKDLTELYEKLRETEFKSKELYRRAIEKYDLFEKHKELRKNINLRKPHNRLSNEDLFKKDTKESLSAVRKRLIKHNIIPYKCAFDACPTNQLQDNLWLGQKVPIDLDHIDGDSSNNELTNLRFLCKICHALTDTYGSRNPKFRKNNKLYPDIVPEFTHCKECNKKLKYESNKTGYCRNCFGFSSNRKFFFEKEDLAELLEAMSTVDIATYLNCTHGTLTLWRKRFGLPLKPHNYWKTRKEQSTAELERRLAAKASEEVFTKS